MFDAVVNDSSARDRRVVTGAMISAAFHAAIVVAAIWLPARALKDEPKKPPPTFVIYQGFPKTVASTAVSAAGGAPRPRRRARSRTWVQPITPAALAKPAIPETPQTEIESPAGESADRSSGFAAGPPGSSVGEPIGNGNGLGNGPRKDPAIPWDTGMPAPQLISGRNPEYTARAREAEVEGSMVAQCVINTAGKLEQCHVLKPLPYMSQAVLDALATRRYQPVMYQGQPIAVEYVFQFHFKLED